MFQEIRAARCPQANSTTRSHLAFLDQLKAMTKGVNSPISTHPLHPVSQFQCVNGTLQARTWNQSSCVPQKSEVAISDSTLPEPTNPAKLMQPTFPLKRQKIGEL